ncbi:ATP-grasp domain-containing protein [Marimonas sp. MJW-29]|uniref:ATP-grasp domain-containing protein n=1 Tax=Sulfitobacter sediminis TaxID=3234186 RepID=A0ABV3RN25_9RHOB
MTTLMILGARMAQLPLIRTALEDGFTVVSVDPDPQSPGHTLAHAAHTCDLADADACIELAKQHRISGVVTLGADYPMSVLAQICDGLGLPGPQPDSVYCTIDKAAMRRAIGGHLHYEISTTADAIRAFREIEAGVVIKPSVSSGGRGITIFPNQTAGDLVQRAFARAAGLSRNGRAILEAYIEGPEFSVETITAGGETTVLAVTEKETSGPPYCVELAHCQPSKISPADYSALADEAVRGLRLLGVDDAPGHTEIRLTASGPMIIEAAARMGGGFIASHLTPLSTGIDMMRAAIAIALGQVPDLRPRFARGAASRFICPPAGYVRNATGLEKVLTDPDCIEADLYVTKGDQIRPLRDATDRVGHVITSGPTGSAAEKAARRLANEIQLEVTPMIV